MLNYWYQIDVIKINYVYRIQEKICGGKFLHLKWNITIHGKSYAIAFCWIISLIDKAFIGRKRFAI